MFFLKWLFDRTPAADHEAPPIGDGRTFRPTVLTDASDAPEVFGHDDHPGDRRCLLEPYFAMIEYIDTNGTRTRRRITMRALDDRDGTLYLLATCHERKAARTFRLDRIQCVISQDGEVEDAAQWFSETLTHYQWTAAPRRPPKAPDVSPKAPDVSPYTALRREITPALTILIASARSDDYLHPREVASILHYAEDEAFHLRNAGLLPGNPEAEAFAKLERTVLRLRPTQEDLTAAFRSLAAWDGQRAARLAPALTATAVADGQIDDIEQSVIDELRAIGAGQHGFGWDDGALV